MAQAKGQRKGDPRHDSIKSGTPRITPPTGSVEDPIASWQRAVGNQAVQRLLRSGTTPSQLILSKHPALGNRALQRLVRSPAPPAARTDEWPRDSDEADVEATHPSIGFGQPLPTQDSSAGVVRRHSIAGAPPAPPPVDEDKEEGDTLQTKRLLQRKPRPGQPAFGKASVLAARVAVAGVRATAIQRENVFSSLNRWARFGSVTLDPAEIPADGNTTAQAAAKSLGAQKTDWQVLAPDYGSTVDAAGLVKAGNALPKGKDRAAVTIQAQDNKNPAAFAQGGLTLWNADLYQAKKDYPRFLKDGPYQFPNFTTGWNGKFDVQYDPKQRLVNVVVKVKFDFADDQPQKGEKKTDAQARVQRQKAYRQSFLDQITKGWSKRYQFKNVREPQSVWGKLNPTNVQVSVLPVNANQHFTIEVAAMHQGAAYVQAGTAHLGKNIQPQQAFNLAGGAGDHEIERIQKIAPDIQFAMNSAALTGPDKATLAFLATYLKRINNPKFNIEIKGYGTKATNAKSRAAAVKAALVAGGVTNHTIRTSNVVQAATRKATITPSLTAGWKNVQDVTLHEFGHMIGLGDEYPYNAPAVNGPATHYDLTKKAFGQQYAEKTARQDITTYSASVMQSGNDVRIQHYVTFWEGLVETTLNKANVPNVKFGYNDWKFVGG